MGEAAGDGTGRSADVSRNITGFQRADRADEDHLPELQLRADRNMINQVGIRGRNFDPGDFQPVLFHQVSGNIGAFLQGGDFAGFIHFQFVRGIAGRDDQRVIFRIRIQAEGVGCHPVGIIAVDLIQDSDHFLFHRQRFPL